jgi:hypothetical protein
MTDTPQLLLAHHLKALKLPTFLREYDKLARQCAAEGLDHIRFLLRLAELELIDRERRMVERRIKEARFPAVKSLDSFDFAAIPSLNKTLVLELARSEYVTRRENELALDAGNPKVPKLPKEALQTRTDFGAPGYGGPCPPLGDHPHRYLFTVFAVGIDSLPVTADTSAAIIGFQLNFNTLANAAIMGL